MWNVRFTIPQTYMLKSNKQFLDWINNFQFDANQKLVVSFDVSSLFTNVPLEIYRLNKKEKKNTYNKKEIEIEKGNFYYYTLSMFATREMVPKCMHFINKFME